ncbi:Zinc finger, SWIM-type domain-containing protein [Strongyloides ratti]|uniref:Zinc finger, SWIM-type domain-containing protein n=1 Tax=Strongyloides ratti TaxID=34506 RepID=A0A090KXF0_STRRB|nr:Zinc finger, SWIM-type domain-containing protein [Strongyloides ratti]CEF59937.1 Zinc finger, SWIM-type domain-containing protein [Strongyloides ratti]
MDRIILEKIKWKDFKSFSYISHIKQDNKRKSKTNIEIPSLFDSAFSVAIKHYTVNEMYNIMEESFNNKEIVDINENLVKYNLPLIYSNIHKLWILNGVSLQTFNKAVDHCRQNEITQILQCGNMLMSNVIDINMHQLNRLRNGLINNKYKTCIEIDKCRILKSICTCNREKRSMCAHIIATCLEKMLYPNKVNIILPNVNGLDVYLKETKMELDDIILNEFDWSEMTMPLCREINMKSCRNYFLEKNIESFNKLTNKTIAEMLMYFEKNVKNIVEYINEINVLNIFLYNLNDSKSMLFNVSVMEEFISSHFKLENLNYFSIYSKDVQNFYEMLKELTYSNEECGFYGSVYLLSQCFLSNHFVELFSIFLKYYNRSYSNAFLSDFSLDEPKFNNFIKESRKSNESIRANIIGYILIECVKNIKRYIYINDISRNDLEGIRSICFKLGNKYENFVHRQSNFTIKVDDIKNLYNPISSLLFNIIEEIQIILKNGKYINERKLYEYNRNNYEKIYGKNFYNLSYGLKQIMNMCKESFEVDDTINDFYIINEKNNLFFSVIEDKMTNCESFDKPLLQIFHSLTSMRIKNKQNIDAINKFIKYWIDLEDTIKLLVTFGNNSNYKIHLPRKHMKKIYDELYECILLIYNMAYCELNRMISSSTTIEVCELLYKVIMIPRIFFYDYVQEIHLWSFQNKFLTIFKILTKTKDKKKEVIKYFSKKMDSFVELFNLEKIHEPGCLISSYVIGMIAKICSDNVNDCTNFSKSYKYHVKNCFNKIILNYLDYNPNIGCKAYFNFLQIFYEDKAKFVVEIIKSNRGCFKFLDEILNKILLSKYGHLYSDDRPNCYSINEKICKHLKTHNNEIAPTIYLIYIIKIIQHLCMIKIDGFYYWRLNDDEIEIRDINNKMSNIYHVSLILTTYGSCINQRIEFLTHDQNLQMVLKIFSPTNSLYLLPIVILEKIDGDNCFIPNNYFDIVFKSLRSKYSDIRNRGVNIILEMLKKVYNIDIRKVGYFFYILERKRNDIKSLKIARKNVIIAFKELVKKYSDSEFYKKNINNNLLNIIIKSNDWRNNIFLSLLKSNSNLLHTYVYRFGNIANIDYKLHYEDTFVIIKDLYKLKKELESSKIKDSFTCIQLENGIKLFCRLVKNNITHYDMMWEYQRINGEIEKITYLISDF